MKLRMTAITVLVLFIFSFTACTNTKPVVATVNGSDITYSEFAYYANYIKSSIEEQNSTSIDNLWDLEVDGQTVSQLINTNALNAILDIRVARDLAAQYNIELTDEDIRTLNSQKAETKRSTGTKEFSDFLKSIGMSEEQYDELMKDNMVANKLYTHLYGEEGISLPTDDVLKADYEDTYFSAKHILISTVDESGAELEAEALAQATELAKAVQLKALAGEDFDALVVEYGEDPGMETYPEGYTFTEGEMVAEFENAVRNLAIDEISEPVKTTYGYHIIRREPLSMSFFDENISSLRDSYRVRAYSELLEEHRNALTVETTETYDAFDIRNP